MKNLSKYNKRNNKIEYYKFSYNKCKLLGKNKTLQNVKHFKAKPEFSYTLCCCF